SLGRRDGGLRAMPPKVNPSPLVEGYSRGPMDSPVPPATDARGRGATDGRQSRINPPASLQAVYLPTADKYSRQTQRPAIGTKRPSRGSYHYILAALSPLCTPSTLAV